MATRSKPYNFSAGPAILPPVVFERAADAIRDLRSPPHLRDAPRTGLSVLEISHRSPSFGSIVHRAETLCHTVLGVPTTHQVLFLQGGASLQFAMVPLNLGQPDHASCYIDTGIWSKKAIVEAKLQGEVHVVATSTPSGYDRIPPFPAARTYANSSYLHLTTNNTIYGTEYSDIPTVDGDVPLVVDCSSHIGSRPLNLDNVALGYAGAQKNLGPSGVTLVFVRKDLIDRCAHDRVPHILRYATHAKQPSLYNTPNTFGIMVLMFVLEWIEQQGGLTGMAASNGAKATRLYEYLDSSQLFSAYAQPESRSQMNVVWNLDGMASQERTTATARFIQAAENEGFVGLKGHRSLGGCRASMYNAFPAEGVDALVAFMAEYERTA
ncbi:MAG: 3-phosphoserine/phosphohydroxythreonine transaminase [Nannocystaceae bacterium]